MIQPLHFKRWENFTRTERKKWREQNPLLPTPGDMELVGTTMHQRRAGDRVWMSPASGRDAQGSATYGENTDNGPR